MQTNTPRRPGELIFNIFVVLASLYLLYTAYGISGFEALSAPGSLPMVTTAIMAICGGMILWESVKKTGTTGEKIERDILPLPVLATIAAITCYAFLLKPLGFLPTSLLFLMSLIGLLGRRGWFFTIWTSALCVVAIYLVFRLIFTVLMPSGVVPEAEILAWFGQTFGGK